MKRILLVGGIGLFLLGACAHPSQFCSLEKGYREGKEYFEGLCVPEGTPGYPGYEAPGPVEETVFYPDE